MVSYELKGEFKNNDSAVVQTWYCKDRGFSSSSCYIHEYIRQVAADGS